MALIVKDRVKETTTTTGPGTVTLAGASAGFQAFSAIGDGNTTFYTLVSGDDWEVGVGMYTLSGTTLSRDTVLESSNAGSAITLAGVSDVFCTYPAEKAVTLNGTVINDANVVATANIVDDAVNASKLNVTGNGTSGQALTSDADGSMTWATILTPTGVETLTNKTLTSPKINEDVVVTSTATELNKLDALSRGSILYGNASAVTSILTKGTATQVLTSDGTDISWSDAASGGLDWQTIITASTLTAVAGRAYWINTTSNTCTITLPSSASNGDQIILADYARTWGTNKIIIDSNGLNYQGEDDTFVVEYSTSGQTINIVYSGATNGWIPLDDDDVEDAPVSPPTQKAIFGYGYNGAYVSMTNLVSNTGVVAADVTGVGTARYLLAAAGYGTDKAIFGYGTTGASVSLTNLVSNTGVVAADVTGVGTARNALAAAGYGTDKAIFGYGTTGAPVSMTNLVSNTGVVTADVTGVGTARYLLAAAGYGTDKAIFGYGYNGANVSMSNLVSNTGVVAADVTGVGTARYGAAAAGYGGDKAIFGYGDTGSYVSMTNLVSNTGVVATDVTGVGTARRYIAAAGYGGDKAIFGYGLTGSSVSMTNLVSSSGVVATDVTGVGTARYGAAAAGYSTTA